MNIILLWLSAFLTKKNLIYFWFQYNKGDYLRKMDIVKKQDFGDHALINER